MPESTSVPVVVLALARYTRHRTQTGCSTPPRPRPGSYTSAPASAPASRRWHRRRPRSLRHRRPWTAHLVLVGLRLSRLVPLAPLLAPALGRGGLTQLAGAEGAHRTDRGYAAEQAEESAPCRARTQFPRKPVESRCLHHCAPCLVHRSRGSPDLCSEPRARRTQWQSRRVQRFGQFGNMRSAPGHPERQRGLASNFPYLQMRSKPG